jgi:replicative DNA helicase
MVVKGQNANELQMLQYLYTGPDVSTYTMEIIESRRASKAPLLKTGIATLDHYMRPWLPGELIFVMAFTSHGKTSLMQAMTRNVVRQLQDAGVEDQIAVYASWETLVEELGLYDLASMTGVDGALAWYGKHSDADAVKLQTAAMRRAGMPLWVLGYSLKRRRLERPMTVDAIDEALHLMEEEHGVRPAVIFADYLQIIAVEDMHVDRRVQVMNNVDKLREMGRHTGAPVVVGCQAGRQILERRFKLPEIGDGQESSRIEQDADKVLALWYPCKTEEDGEIIDEMELTVSPDLMVMGVRKQRHGPSGAVFPLRFDPNRDTFTAWQDQDVLGDEPGTERIPF